MKESKWPLMLMIGEHLARNPDSLMAKLALVLPDWLLHILWRLKGDFHLSCGHNNAREYLTVELYNNKKLLWRARISLCDECVEALP